MTSPIPTGEGETIEERVEDFIDKYNNSIGFMSSSNVVISEDSATTGKNIFLGGLMHQLSLEQLRELPRYLFDISLRPKNTVISAEYYSYWGWTLAFAQYLRRNTDIFRDLTNPSHPDPMPSPGSVNLINDMFKMHRFLCLPLRMTAPVPHPLVDDYLKNALKLTSNIRERDALRMFGPLALSLLDGLICRHCDDFVTIDGDLRKREQPVDSPWSQDCESKSGVNYHDRLQIWRFFVSNETTEDTLDQIDDISRYDTDHLNRLAGVMDSEGVDDLDHLLQLITNQRNYNVHGEGSSVSIFPLTFTLYCLIFWDIIDQDEYDEYLDEVLYEVRANALGTKRESDLTDFYPMYDWQAVGLMKLYQDDN